MGTPGRNRIAPVVLFVLAGGHARIIGGHHHECAPDTRVRCGEQHIRGNIQAHVLHGDDGPRIPEGSAEGYFRGDLLVWRPLRLAA